MAISLPLTPHIFQRVFLIISLLPNDELLFLITNGATTIFSITSTGSLVNGTYGPQLYGFGVDPLGRGFLGRTSDFTTFGAYTINYNSRTYHQITTFPQGNGA